MSKLILVKQILFDTETAQPVLELSDGSTRVVNLIPTGNCWVESWVTPEEKQASIRAAKLAPTEWLDQILDNFRHGVVVDCTGGMIKGGSRIDAAVKSNKYQDIAAQAILNRVEATTVPLLDQKCYNCGNFTVAIDNRARCPYCGCHVEIDTQAKQLIRGKD